jgi:DNA topoisomerase-3
VTDILSPTDGKPLRETLRGYKSQDGTFMIYKVIGGRRMEEAEIRELVTAGKVGPLDGFVSARTHNQFAALIKLAKDEEGVLKATFDFGDKADLGALEPFWADPKTGAELCENGNSYVLRERDPKKDGEWKQTFRVSRLMCKKDITHDHAIQLISAGKTDLITGFTSKKGRPFDAFLVRKGERISWEFPPRAPKLDKDGKPIPRKERAKVDLSKARVIGDAKTPAGELVEQGDAYYVRKPDQDNREVFKLAKRVCERDISEAEAIAVVNDGRTPLLEGFVSKRGKPFSAHLVLSKKKDRADFEFAER